MSDAVCRSCSVMTAPEEATSSMGRTRHKRELSPDATWYLTVGMYLSITSIGDFCTSTRRPDSVGKDRDSCHRRLTGPDPTLITSMGRTGEPLAWVGIISHQSPHSTWHDTASSIF